MTRTSSLRHRLITATFGMTVATSVLFGGGVYLALDTADDELFDRHLYRDVSDFMAQYELNPAILGLPRENFAVHVTRGEDRSPLPAYLRSLPADVDEVDVNGREYDLVIVSRGANTFYFLFDESEFSAYEQRVMVTLLLTVAAVLAASGWLSFFFADRIIAPVSDLAARILRLDESGDARLEIDENGPRDEIYDLSRSVNYYHERIRLLLQRERDFSSDVAHELRTPLMGIQGAAENLEKALGGTRAGDGVSGDARVAAFTGRIRRCCMQATTLVDALLYLARDASNLEQLLEPVQVDDIVSEQVSSLREISERRGVVVNVHREQSPTINAIPSVISVVLGNLLRNAVTHTNKQAVDVYVSDDSIVIQDYGPGIDTALQPAMFDRFTRGAGPNVSGSGIGLALVRRFCQQCRWAIDVKSGKGTGTRIALTF